MDDEKKLDTANEIDALNARIEELERSRRGYDARRWVRFVIGLIALLVVLFFIRTYSW